MSWAHKQDAEWRSFVAENAKGESRLVFGRITYQMMAGFWPTRQAIESLPAMAARMNGLSKIVFSRTLDKASWSNTELLKGDLSTAIKRLKKDSGPDMTVLGSGNLVSQLAQLGLVDEFQLVVNPIILGKGQPLFSGIERHLALKPIRTRTFGNGNVLLCYAPA
jgi:dihydrofolate reductase